MITSPLAPGPNSTDHFVILRGEESMFPPSLIGKGARGLGQNCPLRQHSLPAVIAPVGAKLEASAAVRTGDRLGLQGHAQLDEISLCVGQLTAQVFQTGQVGI